MSRQPVRIGILGSGAIAQVVHLPILARMKGVEIAALCDPDIDRARTIAKRMSIQQVSGEPDDLFSDPELDGVIICTPSDLHETLAVGALAAGKHVLCEKPLALSASGARTVLNAARESAGTLMVAMNQRFRPDAVALKSYIEGGELGEIRHVTTGWLARNAVPSLPSWRHDRSRSGGGALMDIGIQMLDLALWMLSEPEPEAVSAVMFDTPQLDVEESTHIFVRLATGASIAVEASWRSAFESDRQYLDIRGSEGGASLSPLRVFKSMEDRIMDVSPELPPRRENPYTASYRQEIQYFVDIVRGRREGELPEDHRSLLAVIEAAYRSASEGREVPLAEVA